MPNYELSNEQEFFVEEAEKQGLQIDYGYSNRFLKGKKCPSVKVKTMRTTSFRARNIQWDKVEDEFVIYAPF